MKTDWKGIGDTLQSLYKRKMLFVNEKEGKATVRSGPQVLAQLWAAPDGVVHIHLRASLLPNDAGIITASVAQYSQIYLDNNFEYARDGKVMWGSAAVSEAIRNISEPIVEPPEFKSREMDRQRSNPN